MNSSKAGMQSAILREKNIQFCKAFENPYKNKLRGYDKLADKVKFGD